MLCNNKKTYERKDTNRREETGTADGPSRVRFKFCFLVMKLSDVQGFNALTYERIIFLPVRSSLTT